MRLMNISEKTRGIGVLFRRVLCDFELGGKLVKKGSKVRIPALFCLTG